MRAVALGVVCLVAASAPVSAAEWMWGGGDVGYTSVAGSLEPGHGHLLWQRAIGAISGVTTARTVGLAADEANVYGVFSLQQGGGVDRVGLVEARDLETGVLVWSERIQGRPVSSPVILADELYVLVESTDSHDGHADSVLALSLATGEGRTVMALEHGPTQLAGRDGFLYLQGEAQCSGAIGTVNLSKVDPRSAARLWTTRLPGCSGFAPLVTQNAVFAAIPGVGVTKVFIGDGGVAWARAGKPASSPVLAGGLVVTLFDTQPLRTRLGALRENSGASAWEADVAWSSVYGCQPAVKDGRLYLPGFERSELGKQSVSNLAAFNVETGEPLWQLSGHSYEPVCNMVLGSSMLATLARAETQDPAETQVLDPVTSQVLWTAPRLEPAIGAAGRLVGIGLVSSPNFPFDPPAATGWVALDAGASPEPGLVPAFDVPSSAFVGEAIQLEDYTQIGSRHVVARRWEVSEPGAPSDPLSAEPRYSYSVDPGGERRIITLSLYDDLGRITSASKEVEIRTHDAPAPSASPLLAVMFLMVALGLARASALRVSKP